jgi:hypothetical protein
MLQTREKAYKPSLVNGSTGWVLDSRHVVETSGPIVAGIKKGCVVKPLNHVQNSGVELRCRVELPAQESTNYHSLM